MYKAGIFKAAPKAGNTPAEPGITLFLYSPKRIV